MKKTARDLMTHYDTIKSLIKPHSDKEDLVFQKFMLYLLNDPKYGAINQAKDKKSIKAIRGVIDLYKEWLDTGKKPEQEIWLKAKDDAWDAATAAAAFASTAAAAAAYASNASNAAAIAATAAAEAGIPRSEVEKAQIKYLDHLITRIASILKFLTKD